MQNAVGVGLHPHVQGEGLSLHPTLGILSQSGPLMSRNDSPEKEQGYGADVVTATYLSTSTQVFSSEMWVSLCHPLG